MSKVLLLSSLFSMQFTAIKKASKTCFLNNGGYMKEVYKIIYQKENGEIFERIRVTLPEYKIGEETSMGWKILDIKYYFQYKWYSSSEYSEYKKALRRNEENPKLYWNLKEWV